jgi:hypothetical protein
MELVYNKTAGPALNCIVRMAADAAIIIAVFFIYLTPCWPDAELACR